MATPKAKEAMGPDPKRILLVEDEYMIAQDMACELRALGAVVVGPVGSLAGALDLAKRAEGIDAAFLDINLDGEHVYPVVDVLLARGIRVAFMTGYDENAIPPRYAGIPRCSKPVTRLMLRRMLKGEPTC